MYLRVETKFFRVIQDVSSHRPHGRIQTSYVIKCMHTFVETYVQMNAVILRPIKVLLEQQW